MIVDPQYLCLKFDQPALYLFYKDLETGSSKRRKMPLRRLEKSSKNELIADLLNRHSKYIGSIRLTQVCI